ncbi:MAG: hypothetical protein J6D06_04065 [Clostridia bacterium]|nr:hypothetical protein [Clostridia bacterium]
MKLKRKGIDLNKQKERNNIFEKFIQLSPQKPTRSTIWHLEEGNTKTGTTGKFFDVVYVWNLPPCVTCPGASSWCHTHCYNLDLRSNIYNIELWCENWWYTINEPKKLETDIINQILDNKEKKIAVRLHSSGDFFSIEYIDMWISICKKLSNVNFWGYTRSWAVPELKPSINELSSLENVNLFASYDSSMHQKPNLKMSITVDKISEIAMYKNKKDFLICPEQYNLVANCANCAFCINKSNKNIVFISH